MSATLVVHDEAGWMPNSAIFEIAVEEILKNLKAQDSALVAKLEESLGGFPYLDLSDLDVLPFNQVLSIIQNIFVQAFETWGAEPNRDHYSFLSDLSELKAMLLLDPRTEAIKQDTRTIHFSHGTSWSAPAWIYDVVLENCLAWAFERGASELVAVILPSWSAKISECDLSKLATPEFQILLLAIKRMHSFYHDTADGRGRLSHAPSFLSVFAPSIITLYQLVQADDRANI